MVRTVKVVRVLSANKEGKLTPELSENSKSSECHKKCRLFIRVARSNSGSMQKVSDANSITSNECTTQGNDNQKSVVNDITSTGVKVIGTFTGNGSRKSTTLALPQKRRQAIVSVQNGGKGIIMNRLKESTPVLTPLDDSSIKFKENNYNDGSKESSHCYPPSEHTAHLLKLLSSGEILSYKELDEIVSYVSYLKSRKLVTDHLLKKKIISLITEPQDFQPDALDDEPPIVSSEVQIPVISPKRRAPSSQDSVPSKMPRLLEVLQGNDLPPGAAQMIERKRSGVLRSRDIPATCEMCGNRVQSTHLKMHHKICKGVLIRRRRAPDGSSLNPEEEKRTRTCPRCGKTLSCDSDFEMHMAVAHKFYWRLEFDEEDEFKAWFREEGLDETMYVATCQTNPHFQQKVYYCAINRNQGSHQKKCPCRLVVKKVPTGIIVRYLILHNHTERFVRRVMSAECRDMIVKLLKEGLSNYEILKRVKETYPKTSMNYYITRESITRLRYRYLRKSRTRKREPLRKTRRAKKVFDDEETDPPFSDHKQPEAWTLPELRNPEVNARNTFSRVEEVNDCSVIEPANF